MKMATKIVTLILFLFISLSFVYAAVTTQTELTISTEANHYLNIKVTDAATGNSVQKFSKNLNATGTGKFTISSMAVKEVNVEAAVSKDGVEIFKKNYGPYSIRSAISITITKEELSGETKEETIENTTQTTEVTGAAITGQEEEGGGIITRAWGSVKNNAKYVLYVLIGAVILAALFFGGRFIIQQKNLPGNIIVRKQSEMVKEQKEQQEQKKNLEMKSKEVTELEKKLQDVQSEFNKIKNKDKIAAAERKLEEDKKLLERLKRGEEV